MKTAVLKNFNYKLLFSYDTSALKNKKKVLERSEFLVDFLWQIQLCAEFSK